jgi:two-component system, cell cycle sensor histidine kinase and response regulator CckA
MPQGGQLTFSLGRIQIRPGQEWPLPNMAAGEWIRLTVRDTGEGISSENLDHIFEPFFTTKAPGEGTGLGLAQVHGIVAQHEGHIAVDSRLGQGTGVTLYLPALILPAEPLLDDDRGKLPQGHGEVVLVVEDNQILRASLVDHLQLWHYQTLEAANGQEALACLSEHSEEVMLVLSDAIMPRMGGVELLQTLQQEGYQIPMILLTGHPLNEEEVGTLRSLGLYAWLSKPPNVTKLAHLLAEALA